MTMQMERKRASWCDYNFVLPDWRAKVRGVWCLVVGHDPLRPHTDYIYGSLPRIHIACNRCDTTLRFTRPTEEELSEIIN